MTLDSAAPPSAPVSVVAPGPVRLPVGLLLSVLAGLSLLVSFPPYGLWWLGPVGVALLAVAAHRRRLRGAAGLGMITGLVFFLPLLAWTNLNTGWLPWVLLSVAQAAFLALLGAASAWVSPLLDRWPAVWPLVCGLLWTAQEALRDRQPFGGFPWGRLAFGQADGPLLRLAVWGGAPLVTFAVAAAGGALAGLWWCRGRGVRRIAAGAGFAAAAVLIVVGPAAVPVAEAGPQRATVALVQGNVPRLGLDFNAQRRAVLDNHVRGTRELARQVAAGRVPRPDLVVWPENSSDIDPLRNADAGQQIGAAAQEIGVPILVGAVLRGDRPGEIRNAGILWRPGTGPAIDQLYVKRHPVPFAEFMPLRPVARLVSDKVDLVKNMVAGQKPGVVRTGPVTLGDVICFEVAYDEIVRDTVTGGAQVLAVQTNNATFDVAEARQQLAMVRLRAVEHGRQALMVSTVGVSGFVDTAGGVHQATGFNTAAVVVGEMRLGGPATLATRLGRWPELAAAVAGLALLALAAPGRLRRRRGIDIDDSVATEER
ncbi:apolipoprotein N-acyltransferase [Krasilnikovia cinnamomea]|uniref:Apolipoprotein N-acyltransferase n=1 Tax=Krasilnikovia cinnamomea TaxID=349313 RepID=A0A4V2G7Y0_9ACTN|nr:apolipoprotein N-acyltransferase [Krasilnikovia cinnamomea]RZU54326.1 apolipoprotein N-acyltransferase [Krasilnikovia cinnamomea]